MIQIFYGLTENGSTDFTHEMGLDLYQYVRTLKPSIIVNNRVDKGRKGMAGMNRKDQRYAGDFGTPEQEILEGTATMIGNRA